MSSRLFKEAHTSAAATATTASPSLPFLSLPSTVVSTPSTTGEEVVPMQVDTSSSSSSQVPPFVEIDLPKRKFEDMQNKPKRHNYRPQQATGKRRVREWEPDANASNPPSEGTSKSTAIVKRVPAQIVKHLPEDVQERIIRNVIKGKFILSKCKTVTSLCDTEEFKFVCERQDFFDSLCSEFGFYGPYGNWSEFVQASRLGNVFLMEELIDFLIIDKKVDPYMRTRLSFFLINDASKYPKTPKDYFTYMCKIRGFDARKFMRTPIRSDDDPNFTMSTRIFHDLLMRHFLVRSDEVFIPGFYELARSFLLESRRSDPNTLLELRTDYRTFDEALVRDSHKRLAMFAIEMHSINFRYCGEPLRNDYDVAIKLVDTQRDLSPFDSLGNDLRRNKAFCKRVVEYSPIDFSHFSDAMQNEPEFILELARDIPEVFQYLPHDYKENFDVARAALMNSTAYAAYRDVFIRMRGNLQSDAQLCRILVHKNPMTIAQIYPVYYQGLDLVEFALQRDWTILGYMMVQARQDPYIVAYAIFQDEAARQLMFEGMEDDVEAHLTNLRRAEEEAAQAQGQLLQ